MRFRPRIAALCSLLALSVVLAVVASARAATPSARPPANAEALAPASAPLVPLDSTSLPMRWGGGGGGGGSSVRIYANRDHVFAVIAGLR